MNEDTKAKIDTLLTDAMNAEAQAKKFYIEAAAKASSNAGKNLFNELADFEQGHYDRLQRIIEARGKGLNLAGITAPQKIPTKSEVEGQFEPNKDEIVSVLTLGIEAEKKARAKYLEISKMFDDEESKAIFINMAEEERKHQSILEDQFYSISNKGTIIWGD
ncbi:MAG: ferritin family protein [candidate division WOR-3 bacterium]|nr:MAG: ferritin family protein [candidate division WOR-3 bacterium]